MQNQMNLRETQMEKDKLSHQNQDLQTQNDLNSKNLKKTQEEKTVHIKTIIIIIIIILI